MAKRVNYEYGADLKAEPAPIIDPATGKTIVLRSFDFNISPRIELKNFPRDKQQIFNDHRRLVETMLWADGLRPFEEAAPRVVINLKKRRYKIIVAAEARADVLFVDKPKPFNEMLTSTASGNGTPRNK